MIDYFSLALGHALLAVAFLRLVMRDNLDVDPAIEAFRDEVEAEREATSLSARAARRREQADDNAGTPVGGRDG